ncbi:hypothetical protein [Roseateles asaccharophilus]|uniref:TraB/GumN family protein n=1 Tax=Roseateles asaccharophilus TaxID=582607 RepID=A0ABU2A4H7_9BURK|nr:hypothetical protein [Roseateles asaccharophilus]MDR7332102.1 hypothetical protein [Roseateles asaccharophilus]
MTFTGTRRAALGLLAGAAAASARAQAPARGEVFIVSTLYARHQGVPAYDLQVLRRLIEAVRPQALVLDVTPTELRTRRVWPGKVEYTGVIFPYLDATGVPAHASEPDEPLFAELTGAVGQAYKAFGERQPAGAKALDDMKQGAYRAMAASWASAADVHSDRTDGLVAALREFEEGLVGAEARRVQEQWDRHHAARLRAAVAAHPGQRVLMLVGIESRYRVLAELRAAGDVEPVAMEAWLRRAGI